MIYNNNYNNNSMLFHLHTCSASHNLKQLTCRSTRKHIIEFIFTHFAYFLRPWELSTKGKNNDSNNNL